MISKNMKILTERFARRAPFGLVLVRFLLQQRIEWKPTENLSFPVRNKNNNSIC